MFNWFGKKEKSQEKSETGSSTTVKSPDVTEASVDTALSSTREGILGKLSGLFNNSDTLSDDDIDTLEESLIRADVGLDTATEIADVLRDRKKELTSNEAVVAVVQREFASILAPFDASNRDNQLSYQAGKMNVYLVVGVNGAGKTTFIGKLANRFVQQGKTVVVGAGDTFRAAAVEQLKVWADRAGAQFVGRIPDGDDDASVSSASAVSQIDPASIMFDTLKKAKELNADVVLLDTAGRLQNKYNLMEELKKVKGVIDKERPSDSNFESLLVLDATTGQNAMQQASVFAEAVDLNGVILTKLDGSAKGGIVLSIARKFKLPVKMVGVREGIEDLKDFDANDFLSALFKR